MSCEYCDIKMRPLDEDTKVLKGESWKDELGYEGGYIGPSHDDKFRMIVNYDAGFACTGVPDIKYCPFCGEELKLPAEPLIKDEKIRKAVRAWAEADDLDNFRIQNQHFNACKIIGYTAGINKASFIGFQTTISHADSKKLYTIDELCGTPEPLEPSFIGLDERIKEKEGKNERL